MTTAGTRGQVLRRLQFNPTTNLCLPPQFFDIKQHTHDHDNTCRDTQTTAIAIMTQLDNLKATGTVSSPPLLPTATPGHQSPVETTFV